MKQQRKDSDRHAGEATAGALVRVERHTDTLEPWGSHRIDVGQEGHGRAFDAASLDDAAAFPFYLEG